MEILSATRARAPVQWMDAIACPSQGADPVRNESARGRKAVHNGEGQCTALLQVSRRLASRDL